MTTDNSVRYIPQNEQTQPISRKIKPNRVKNASNEKKLLKKNEKLLKNITAEGFGILKRITDCYF